MKYSAFISYLQNPDRRLADGLQKGLRQLGAKKYMLKFRALEIFRDETDSAGHLGLKEKIERGIDASEFLVLLANPAITRASTPSDINWAEEEIKYWLSSKHKLQFESGQKIEDLKIIICITAGNIKWDYSESDFEWEVTNCLPKILKERFSDVPLWVDFREIKKKEAEGLEVLSLEYPEFKQKVAEISAKIQGTSVDKLIAKDLQSKRIWTVFLSVLAVLLLTLSITSLIYANRSRKNAALAKTETLEADRQKDIARSKEQEALESARVAKRQRDIATEALRKEAIASQDAKLKQQQAEDALLRETEANKQAQIQRKEAEKQKTNAQNRLAHTYWLQSQTKRKEGDDLTTSHYIGEALKANNDSLVNHSLSTDGRLYQTNIYLTSILCQDNSSFLKTISNDGKMFLTRDALNLVGRNDSDTYKLYKINDTDVSQVAKIKNANSVAFSKDGKLILTANLDSSISILDATTGNAIGYPKKYPYEVKYANFNYDGKVFLTINDSNIVEFWRTENAAPLGNRIYIKDSRYSSNPTAVFSPDGTKVLSNNNNTTQLWNAETGTSIRKSIFGLLSSSFSPGGTFLLTVEVDTPGKLINKNIVRLYNVNNCNHHCGEIRHEGESIIESFFSPSGTEILTLSDNSIKIWHIVFDSGVVDLHMLQNIIAPDRENFKEASISPDGKKILATLGSYKACIYDMQTGLKIGKTIYHGRSIYSAAFFSDGMKVLTTGSDKTIRIWDVSNCTIHKSPNKHSVENAIINPARDRVFAMGKDSIAQIWDAVQDSFVTKKLQHKKNDYRATYNYDGGKLLTVDGQNVYVWDGQTGSLIKKSKTYINYISNAVFSPDGAKILITSYPGMDVWDLHTGDSVRIQLEGDIQIKKACFSQDGTKIVTLNNDNVQIWDARSGVAIGNAMKLGKLVDEIELSPDGNRIAATITHDGIGYLWDANNGTLIGTTMKFETFLSRPVFSPDGSILVFYTYYPGSIQILNALTGASTGIHGITDGIENIVFSSDGQRILIQCSVETQVWDSHKVTPIGEPMVCRTHINKAIFSPDGSLVLTATDSVIQLWDSYKGLPIGSPQKYGSKILDVLFTLNGAEIVVATEENPAIVSNIGIDKDIPSDLYELQNQVVTGSALNLEAGQSYALSVEDWHKLKEKYLIEGGKHYDVCRFKPYNVWKRITKASK